MGNLDVTGKFFAAATCLDSDGRMVVGGCAAGSVRAWKFIQGKICEVYKFSKAHSEAVTAISLATYRECDASSGGDGNSQSNLDNGSNGEDVHVYATLPVGELLVTFSEDCSIRIWKATYERI